MITLYSKKPCPQCDQAKMLLQMKGIPTHVKTLNVDFTLEELMQLVPTQKTFPVVFDGETLIGGFMELRKWIASK